VSTMPDAVYGGSDASNASSLFFGFNYMSAVPDTNAAALFLARAGSGAGAAIPALLLNDRGAPTMGNGAIPYPHPYTGGLFWDRAAVLESANLVRGFMPGVVVPWHDRPFADLQLVTDLPDMPAGTKWLAKRFAGSAPANGFAGEVIFDLGAWQ